MAVWSQPSALAVQERPGPVHPLLLLHGPCTWHPAWPARQAAHGPIRPPSGISPSGRTLRTYGLNTGASGFFTTLNESRMVFCLKSPMSSADRSRRAENTNDV